MEVWGSRHTESLVDKAADAVTVYLTNDYEDNIKNNDYLTQSIIQYIKYLSEFDQIQSTPIQSVDEPNPCPRLCQRQLSLFLPAVAQ